MDLEICISATADDIYLAKITFEFTLQFRGWQFQHRNSLEIPLYLHRLLLVVVTPQPQILKCNHRGCFHLIKNTVFFGRWVMVIVFPRREHYYLRCTFWSWCSTVSSVDYLKLLHGYIIPVSPIYK